MLIDRLRSAAVLIAISMGCLFADSKFSAPGTEGFLLIPLLLFFALGTTWDVTSLLLASGRNLWRTGCMIAVGAISLGSAIPTLVNAASQFSGGAIGVYPENCPIGPLGWAMTMAIASLFALLIREMRTYGVTATNDLDTAIDLDASIASSDTASEPSAGSMDRPSGRDRSSSIDRTMRAAFVSLYIGLPMSLLFSIRGLGSDISTSWGLAALLTMIAVTKSADAGAYFAGKALGRHKLIPRLSPGKTWEGAIGGVLMSTLVAMACFQWLFPAMVAGSVAPASLPSIGWALILGPALAITGMVGDLAESMFKRDCGAKDSGNWLPGLGGVWDVTDSLIAAILPAFLCLAAAA
ncbi:Phosphatidate cytidylyltransferase [Rhodopirellula islandica]|uniref:Phosphatidate cytidylyltransferase n=1 Tax=Rhodopirellula islandica TaxID=595434 RepID=A0A0J1BG20_RHOIS|nr:phosphatidate cytidylyltransferase [Rhodopirellula islandica]KLU05485.1 Phosphatidate cytidylyltransferase [Rhodopirellula islandica]